MIQTAAIHGRSTTIHRAVVVDCVNQLTPKWSSTLAA